MVPLKKHELEKLARETGFIQNALEKMLRLIDTLGQVARHPFLKNCFALKGGTAFNLFAFNLPRLSVDADLNYVKTADKDAMLIDRAQIATAIKTLFTDDYRIALTKEEYALAQFELHYKALSGSLDKFKLEINYLHRQPIVQVETKTCTLLHLNLIFPVLAFEELLAGKIIALLSRYTPRDLFDVYQAAMAPFNYSVETLRALIIFYGLLSRASVFDLFSPDFSQISVLDIDRHLTPLLIRGKTPDRLDMVTKVEGLLKPLVALAEDESNIIKTFYTSGVLDVEALFPDAAMQNKIKTAPSLLWKIHNIQSLL